MSPWYHLAMALTGFMIDIRNVPDIEYEITNKVGTTTYTISKAHILQTFWLCVYSHIIMVIMSGITTLFNMRGRYTNKINHTIERSNAWLFLASSFDLFQALGYLLFSLYLSYTFQRIQICMWNEKI